MNSEFHFYGFFDSVGLISSLQEIYLITFCSYIFQLRSQGFKRRGWIIVKIQQEVVNI